MPIFVKARVACDIPGCRREAEGEVTLVGPDDVSLFKPPPGWCWITGGAPGKYYFAAYCSEHDPR